MPSSSSLPLAIIAITTMVGLLDGSTCDWEVGGSVTAYPHSGCNSGTCDSTYLRASQCTNQPSIFADNDITGMGCHGQNKFIVSWDSESCSNAASFLTSELGLSFYCTAKCCTHYYLRSNNATAAVNSLCSYTNAPSPAPSSSEPSPDPTSYPTTSIPTIDPTPHPTIVNSIDVTWPDYPPVSPGKDFVIGTDDFIFECDVYHTQYQYNGIIFANDIPRNPSRQFRLMFSALSMEFATLGGVSQESMRIQLSSAALNRWYRVTLSREGTKYSLYLNGVLKRTKIANSVANVNWDYPVYIGMRHGEEDAAFNGLIKNARYRNYIPAPTTAPTPTPTTYPTRSAWIASKHEFARCSPSRFVGTGIGLAACQAACTSSGDCGVIYGQLGDHDNGTCYYCPKTFTYSRSTEPTDVAFEYSHNALVLRVDDLNDSNNPAASNCFPISSGSCNLRSAYIACMDKDISHFLDDETCHILLPRDVSIFMAKNYDNDRLLPPKKRIKYYDNETFTQRKLHGSCCYSCPYVGDCSAVVLTSSETAPCVENKCSKPPSNIELLIIRAFREVEERDPSDVELYDFVRTHKTEWSTYDELQHALKLR